MTHVINYADGQARSRVWHEGDVRGGRVVVPPARSRTPLWVMLAGGAFLGVTGCGATLIPATSVVGAVSTVVGILLFVAAMIQLALPGSEPAAVFSYVGPPGAATGLGAEVYLAGEPVPQVLRWHRGEIDDVQFGFARGFANGEPAMELVVTAVGRQPVGLVPPQRDPKTLHLLATIVRGVLGLPPARDVREAWLRSQAARREPDFEAAAGDVEPSDGGGAGASPPPLPGTAVAAVPVLGYREPRGVEVGSMLDRADITPQRLTLTLARHDGFDRHPVWLQLTPDRLEIGAHESHVHAWPCDDVYGVFVDFAGHNAPAELCVCAAGGNVRLLRGARTRTLRELADLVNSALGIAGSAY